VGDSHSVKKEVTFNKPDLVVLDPYTNRDLRWDVLAHIKVNYPESVSSYTQAVKATVMIHVYLSQVGS
jgi:hypothetical protein